MTRRDREVGIIKACVLGAVLAAGLTTAAYADNKLTLSGSASFTTNYEFRGVSNSSNDPAVQPEIDLGYGIFWAYMWGSNTAFGDNIEIDYGGGISPKWGDFTFTIGGLEYTYPGKDSETDYFELKTAVAYGKGPWAISLNNYWSPNNFALDTQSDALEGDVGYTFSGKIWNFFTPSISGAIGAQMYQKENIVPSYLYWNAGVTLGFMDHWSVDVRYWDTDYSKTDCAINSGARDNCDATAVATIKATF
ncbi:MAG: TorF family putative porin [Actinomycetota bacterium]